MNKYREFKVVPGIQGFKVVIGCSEVYFGDEKDLAISLNAYLSNPEEMEKKMLSKDIRFRGMEPTMGVVEVDERPPVNERARRELRGITADGERG